MTDFKYIYNHQARLYDEMVSFEDYQERLLPALAAIRPLAGLQVVELGAGTGRLTRLLAPVVAQILAMDISAHMLTVARRRLAAAGFDNWQTAVADNRRLPLAAACADLALVGWSLGHFPGWYPQRWRAEIGRSLAEMRRVVRPGGAIVIIETQGTGRETPRPPTEALAAYYAFLEQEEGFASTWIRTDYRFDSPAQTAKYVRFFFGDEMAAWVAEEQLTILPECTGLWWHTR